jgi:hypothetical protein
MNTPTPIRRTIRRSASRLLDAVDRIITAAREADAERKRLARLKKKGARRDR